MRGRNREVSVFDLTSRGEYKEAFKFAKDLLSQEALGQIPPAILPFTYVYIAKLNTEVGLLQFADRLLDRAESLRTSIPDFWEPLVSRERAELQLASADYERARESAEHAVRSSPKSKAYRTLLAYGRALLAIAHLRSGHLAPATASFDTALDAVPKNPAEMLIVAPRILYTACLLESHKGNYEQGRELCLRGLNSLEKAGITSRDVSLGLLALSESHLLAGDTAKSAEIAKQSLELTRKMFGRSHQDMIQALWLLARAASRDGRDEEARTLATQAVTLSESLFGQESAGLRQAVRVLEGVRRQ